MRIVLPTSELIVPGKPTLTGAVLPRFGHRAVVVVAAAVAAGVVTLEVLVVITAVVAVVVEAAVVAGAVPSGADAEPVDVVGTEELGDVATVVEGAIAVVLAVTAGPDDEHAVAAIAGAITTARTSTTRRMAPLCAQRWARWAATRPYPSMIRRTTCTRSIGRGPTFTTSPVCGACIHSVADSAMPT